MKRTWLSLLPLAGLFVLILLSLSLMGYAAQNSERFGQYYIALLFFNLFLLVLLAGLVVVRILAVVRDLFRRRQGARLTWRLLLMFIFAALGPVLVVYVFSVKFLTSGIDSWFDVDVEHSLEQALELSRLSLDHRMQAHLEEVQRVARQLVEVPDVLVGLSLNDFRLDLGARELTLLGFKNRIIATSTEQHALVVPRFPSDDIMVQLAQGKDYVGLEPAPDGGLQIRVVARLPQGQPLAEPRILVAVFPLSARMSRLAESVQQAYTKYKGLAFLRRPLKQNFQITLSLVLLVSTLFAVWAAFFLARRLLSPILELAEATRRVAEGDYQQHIEVTQHDELGFLAQSFNEMTEAIRQAREAAEISQQLVENQRSYLQTVLRHLSSGVLTLDSALRIRTANDAADQILEMDRPLQSMVGQHLADVARARPVLQAFYDQIVPELLRDAPEWQKEVRLFGEAGRKILICRGARLPDQQGNEAGQVIVMDDVTDLITAQRDAAWGEVARRLAHEIKNPLTPIQLSAERLAHKLGRSLPPDQAEILQRATGTIVRQVEAMRDMVNAFRDYASTPPAQITLFDFNQLVREVVDMYSGYADHIEFVTRLAPDLPSLQGDAGRLRQVLHNLIKNALEAIGERPGRIELATRHVESSKGHYVELTVRDNGPGIAEDLLPQLFEPYVTNKHKGTGLGLAIVKKIVEEHGGMVTARNAPEGGAEFIIRLPERYRPKTTPAEPTEAAA